MQRSIQINEELTVSADRLWRTISDFAHIDRWARLTVRAIEGHGPGCQRTVEMASGIRVTERLLWCDPVQMAMAYEIVEPNPYPMYGYRSTMRVEPTANGHSRLHWTGEYTPAADTDPVKTDHLLRKVYGGGVQLLIAYFACCE